MESIRLDEIDTDSLVELQKIFEGMEEVIEEEEEGEEDE